MEVVGRVLSPIVWNDDEDGGRGVVYEVGISYLLILPYNSHGGWNETLSGCSVPAARRIGCPIRSGIDFDVRIEARRRTSCEQYIQKGGGPPYHLAPVL